MDSKALGLQVYSARTDRDLTHEAMADLCNITPGYLRQIEQGSRLPSLPLFITMCEKLRVPPIVLLRGNLMMERPTVLDRFSKLMLRVSPKQLEILVSILEAIEKFIPKQ